MLSIAGANRDPCENSNPDAFDIEREKVVHVSFGYGIHLCLGMSLARLEAKIVFSRLFERFSSLEFAEAAPNWGSNPMFRGLETLTVRCRNQTHEAAVGRSSTLVANSRQSDNPPQLDTTPRRRCRQATLGSGHISH